MPWPFKSEYWRYYADGNPVRSIPCVEVERQSHGVIVRYGSPAFPVVPLTEVQQLLSLKFGPQGMAYSDSHRWRILEEPDISEATQAFKLITAVAVSRIWGPCHLGYEVRGKGLLVRVHAPMEFVFTVTSDMTSMVVIIPGACDIPLTFSGLISVAKRPREVIFK